MWLSDNGSQEVCIFFRIVHMAAMNTKWLSQWLLRECHWRDQWHRYCVITWKREGIHGSTVNSSHKGRVTQALVSSFMVTKRTFELPVSWEAGACDVLVIEKPFQTYHSLDPLAIDIQTSEMLFSQFWVQCHQYHAFSKAHENISGDLPVSHYQTRRINSKVIHFSICSNFRANHFRNIELIVNNLFSNSLDAE